MNKSSLLKDTLTKELSAKRLSSKFYTAFLHVMNFLYTLFVYIHVI